MDVYIVLMVCFLISCGIVVLSRLVVRRSNKFEKMEGYECGFQPFKTELGEFDVQFYIVALLFLIFDVELMLLFPWSIISGVSFVSTYLVFVSFMVVLIVGMVYEWLIGGLEFER